MSAPYRPSVITPTQLEEIGRTLYGEHWEPDLARALGISRRAVTYYLDGSRPIHAGIALDLAIICIETSQLLRDWGRKLSNTVTNHVGD